MNKHGQRRKETCPCTANLTFLVQNYIFLSIIPQIYRDNCGFLPLPKCKKAGYGTRKTTPSTTLRKAHVGFIKDVFRWSGHSETKFTV